MSRTAERRPTAAASEAWQPETSVGQIAAERPELSAAEVYAVIRGRLAVLVLTKRPDGSVLTRSFVNMRSADRAASRARDRGCAATVVLVRQDVAPLVGGGAR